MTLRELQTIYRENCIHDGLLYDHQPRPGVHEAHLNALAAVQRAVESSCGEALGESKVREAAAKIVEQAIRYTVSDGTANVQANLPDLIRSMPLPSQSDKEESK